MDEFAEQIINVEQNLNIKLTQERERIKETKQTKDIAEEGYDYQ